MKDTLDRLARAFGRGFADEITQRSESAGPKFPSSVDAIARLDTFETDHTARNIEAFPLSHGSLHSLGVQVFKDGEPVGHHGDDLEDGVVEYADPGTGNEILILYFTTEPA